MFKDGIERSGWMMMWPFTRRDYTISNEELLERRIEKKICDINMLKAEKDRLLNSKTIWLGTLKTNLQVREQGMNTLGCYLHGKMEYEYVIGASEDFNIEGEFNRVSKRIDNIMELLIELVKKKNKKIDGMVESDSFMDLKHELNSTRIELDGKNQKLMERVRENTKLNDIINQITNTRGKKHFLKRLEDAEKEVKELKRENECLVMALKKVGE